MLQLHGTHHVLRHSAGTNPAIWDYMLVLLLLLVHSMDFCQAAFADSHLSSTLLILWSLDYECLTNNKKCKRMVRTIDSFVVSHLVLATLDVRLNTTVAKHEACGVQFVEFVHVDLRRSWTVGECEKD